MATEKWAGFTDEDIERIKTNPATNPNVCIDMVDGNFLKQNAGPMKLKEIAFKTCKQKNLSDMTKKETSASDLEVNNKPQHLKKNMKSRDYSVPITSINDPIIKNASWEQNGATSSDDSVVSSDTSVKEENFEEMIMEPNANISELEVFELRQKRIEAENVRRRALINKAIMDKKMQTQAEAIKLAKISQELSHLDSILSADVSILRDYIEKASLEFSEAEKRYLRAEKEFIEAKLNLFEKMQRKEQLTEHLCAIIEQNENRKANKLVELMKQLEMEAIIEDFEENETHPILSKYCILNEEAYHCCQTLKPSSQNVTSIISDNNPEGILDKGSKHNTDHCLEPNSEVPHNSLENSTIEKEKSDIEQLT